MEARVGDAKRLVFVTVGTTSFDALVKAVVSQNVKSELQKRGYTHLLIQMGRGIFFPTKCDGADGSLVVDHFTFSSSIADYIRSASLVISHAVNEDLMDNHQCELAEELQERKHLYCARPHTLHQAVTNMELESLVRYPPGDGTPVARIIDRFLGFPDD
ncbi:unnamed protein product [Microthlaspi erraticum]|uniref:Glycosyl transferase family 28 C-terminal domain-containing protein n=1 Tax=Microthlaspi erraticum TaxID=1685480 RepID=A0A6D2IA94_9BRAS|nr:unnamed protein product [Microthlaspi erraticum]